MINLLTKKTVACINKTIWIELIKKVGLRNYSSATSKAGIDDLLRYLRSAYTNENSDVLNNLDDLIFKQMAFEQPNTYKIEKINVSGNITPEVFNQLEDTLNINRSFYDETLTAMIKVISSRLVVIDNTVSRIIMLVKVGETNDKTMFGVQNVIFNVTIDFDKKLISTGYHKGSFEKYYNESFAETYEKMIHWLSVNVLANLNVTLSEFNEEALKTTLYKMFHELTAPIENKLELALPPNVDGLIQNFFDDVGIQLKEKYQKQLYSILFQDYGDAESTEFQEGLYDDGWIFRFGFRDGDFTRATSRTEDQSPVYTSPIYWNLKELINEKTKLTDAGFVWVTDTGMIEAKIDVQNKAFIIYLYKTEHEWEEDRIEYIRRKIIQHL